MKLCNIFLLVLLCLPALAVLKEANVLGVPNLIHDKSNCWLNSATWVLYNIPELKEDLVGKGGEGYFTVPLPEDDYQKRLVKTAQTFTQFVRVLNSGSNNSLAESQALRNALDMPGEDDPTAGVNGILTALKKQAFLWAIKVTDFEVVNGGIGCLIDTPDDWAKLPERGLTYLLGDVQDATKNPQLTLLEANQKGALLFDELCQYLIFKIWIGFTSKGDPQHSPAGSLLMTISLEPFASPKLKKKVKEAGLSLEYELIGLSMYEGWAHYTAYVKDQYDPKHPWYHCNDIHHPLCTVATEKEVQGPWIGGRYPRVLVYRRMGGAGDGSQKTTTAGAEQLAPLASALQALAGKK